MKFALALASILLPAAVSSFSVVPPQAARLSSTRLYLEDRIANLIDEELHRLQHKDEFDKQAAEAFKKVVQKHKPDVLPEAFESDSYIQEEFISPRQLKRDQKMASDNPQAYCADRCIATGNCDVFEDIFEMSPQQVITFCDECVLSDDEEPCDVPDAFLNLKP